LGMVEQANDNGSESIRVADWREAMAIRPSNCLVRCDDGWDITFGKKMIMPGILKGLREPT
jgi:hypothetical protein